MKFGKEIKKQSSEHPRYKNFYLNYKELKLAVNQLRQVLSASPSVASTSPPARLGSAGGLAGGGVCLEEARFRDLLRQQLEKVNNFVKLQWEVIIGELRARQRTQSASSAQALESLAEELIKLDRFVRVNAEGFRKISKKCDKHCNTAFLAWFMPQVEAAPFRQCDFDIPLRQLGRLYAKIRAHHPDPGDGVSEEVYVVPLERIMAAKVALAQHFDVPGSTSGSSASSTSRVLPRFEEKTAGASRRLHALWCDNARGEQFSSRYQRHGQSGASRPAIDFRLRWAGPDAASKAGQGDQDVVHLDVAYSAAGATLEVPLKQREAAALVAGQNVLGALAISQDAKQALLDVQRIISEGGLSPWVSASFCRSVFERKDGGSSGQPAAVLDEDLVFQDETSGARDPASWCSSGDGKLVAMPKAVLRLRGGAPLELVAKLQDLGLLQVAFFSKGLCGMLMLHQEQLRGLDGCPEDLSVEAFFRSSEGPKATPERLGADRPGGLEPETHAGNGCPPPRSPASVPARNPGAAAAAAAFLGWAAERLQAFARATAGAWEGPAKDLLVDCKTPLSNERTVLRWFRSAVLLASLSALLSSSAGISNQLNGLLLGGVAVLFVFWPLAHFDRRSREIEKPWVSGQPAAHRTMPQALAMCLATILTAVLVVHAVFSDDGTIPVGESDG
eukprot:TRINITY_DN7872_c1_g1_i1.p1 TRINITY_DN7872_c1_g1~~TRINITY_DN7872_c1_g1_i1.p1  ORF type:complete len:674 (-),score=142.90 TRINITY_DN7872_c1_g1_i1:35-2056(-)